MDGLAIVLFLVSLIAFLVAMYMIWSQPVSVSPAPVESSGLPTPSGSMIGAQCPVGCTCFPDAGCGFLSDNVMFSCPSACCQPSCVP